MVDGAVIVDNLDGHTVGESVEAAVVVEEVGEEGGCAFEFDVGKDVGGLQAVGQHFRGVVEDRPADELAFA